MNYLYFIIGIFVSSISFGQVNSNSISGADSNQTAPATPKKEESPLDKTILQDSNEGPKNSQNRESNKKDKIETKDKMTKSMEIKGTSDDELPNDELKKDSDKSTTLRSQEQTLKNSFIQTKIASSTQTRQRSPSPLQQAEMQNVVDQYQKTAPNSFEYYYFKYVSGNYNVDLIGDLLEAKKLKPNNVDVHVQLAAYYFIKKDDKNLKENLDFLFQTKKIEPELPTYAEHLLESVTQNGILITHGFDDTYSVLYVQKILNKREDVQLISLDFLQSEFYRNSLKNSGFSIPKSTIIDVDFLESFCEANSSKNLQLSMTIPKPYLEEISSKLSVLGLSMLYDENPTNLIEKNIQIYEKFIQTDSFPSFTSEKTKKLSSNYLPMLISLKNEYEKLGNMTGEASKSDTKYVEQIETAIQKIKVQSALNKKM